MKKNIFIFSTILLIIIFAILIFFYFNNKLDKNIGWGDRWGVEVQLELTKGEEIRNIEGEMNFPFSENPLLVVQLRKLEEKGDGAYFIIKWGEKDQTAGPWKESEEFYLKIGENYYYEILDLNIRLLRIDTSSMCPKGMIC